MFVVSMKLLPGQFSSRCISGVSLLPTPRSLLSKSVLLALPLLFESGAEATVFSGPASVLNISTASNSPECNSAVSFSPVLTLTDTADGFSVSGDLIVTSTGLAPGIEGCAGWMFFSRTIGEAPGTVFNGDTSMAGSLDAAGPFQLYGGVFGYSTLPTGIAPGCGATARDTTPGAGLGVPFSSGLVQSGPCVTISSTPRLFSVFQFGVNAAPGSLTLHFDSLLSEVHVQVVPEPPSGRFTGMTFLVLLAVRSRGETSRPPTRSARIPSGPCDDDVDGAGFRDTTIVKC
jgi:hypothetical protein